MYLQETDEQQALRTELRAYFAELLSPEVRADIGYRGEGGEGWRRIVKQMGTDGWLGIGWPKEFGGQGRPATDQFIFYDEVQRAKAPVPFVTLNTVGPTLMRYGTEEQKATFLPQIVAGEVNFAIGYTEPGSGTDLASLQTRAVRDGDEYVINGNKIFTSGANDADWVWLACRTDPEAKKHRGISMILVPTDAPGFSWTPIVTVGENRTTATYYDDVRVPVTNLVGEENGGWQMITTQLNHERIGLAAHSGEAHELYADVRDWAAGNGVLAQSWVRADLAKCHALLDAMHLLNWKLTTAVANDELDPADASAVKVYGTEAVVEVYHLLLGILGAAGYLREGSPGAVISGRVEQAGRSAQINTFGGGVNEIQREIVAWMGLGMTRGAR
jgi:alkylation response protein AidB-like acyl-CoA dehydrogenase